MLTAKKLIAILGSAQPELPVIIRESDDAEPKASVEGAALSVLDFGEGPVPVVALYTTPLVVDEGGEKGEAAEQEG